MNVKQQSSKSYFFTMNMVFFVILISQIIFGFIVLLLLSKKTIEVNQELTDLFMIVLSAIYVLIIITGFIVSKKKLKQAKEQPNLPQKLGRYQSVAIIRWAMLEGLTLLAGVFSLVAGNLLFLIYACVSVLLLISFRPTRNRVSRDLELDRSSQDLLDDRDAIVAEIILPDN